MEIKTNNVVRNVFVLFISNGWLKTVTINFEFFFVTKPQQLLTILIKDN